MSRKCDLLGIVPQFGNNVSHSNRKSRRKFLPNLHLVSFFSPTLGGKVKLHVSTKACRSVDKYKGIDLFFVDGPVNNLSPKASRVRKRILECKKSA